MHMSEVSGDSENALVSIIVPVYNVEPYLRQCLDSLLSQSYRNLQIVCVNDGSTDGSPAILEEYAARDSRVCVIHQPNGGLSAARNKALTVCKGKWLMFCDSDDYLADSRAVAKMCGYVEACGGNIGLCGFCKYDDGSGKSVPMLPLPGIAESGCYTITPDLVSLVVTRCYMFNKMFRKELIDRLQLQFDVGRIYEDVAFSLIAFLACMGERIAVCNDKLYHYRQRDGSILATMRKKDPRAMDALFGVEQVLTYLNDRGELLKYRTLALRILSYYRSIAFADVPEEMQPEVCSRTRGMVQKFNLNCSAPEKWKYGIHPIPKLIRKLFFFINMNRRSFKLLGIPLFSIIRKEERFRIAVLGIPVYQRRKVWPHEPLPDI